VSWSLGTVATVHMRMCTVLMMMRLALFLCEVPIFLLAQLEKQKCLAAHPCMDELRLPIHAAIAAHPCSGMDEPDKISAWDPHARCRTRYLQDTPEREGWGKKPPSQGSSLFRHHCYRLRHRCERFRSRNPPVAGAEASPQPLQFAEETGTRPEAVFTPVSKRQQA
jgi:hypothetical protein